MSTLTNSLIAKIKALQPKISGDNWMNYWGWRFSGGLCLCLTLGLIAWAVIKGAPDSPECLLLLAICMVLLAQFCLNLQNYGARVMRNIEAEEAKKQNAP